MSSHRIEKSRSYCFTINNYTIEDVELIKKLKYQYILLGNEKGENETPHIQGYVYFQNPIAFNTLKKHCPRGHIEVCKGSPQSNIDYCKKQGDIIFEDGEKPCAGKRNDLAEIREAVLNNESMQNIITNYSANYQAVKYAETIRKYLEPKRNWMPNIKWYYGETGTGKSKTAYEELGENAYFQNGSKWWDGYDAHESVIIDDFRPQDIEFSKLLKLLDRYPYIIENKGGTRQFLAKTIIITSPKHPIETFKHVTSTQNENIEQLTRRFTEIRQFIKTT